MNPLWYVALVFVGFCLACLLLGLMSADSRPGWLTGRFDQKERWFIHSIRD